MLKKYIAAALCALSLSVSAQKINPITQAMLEGYGELLAQNPNDYLTLYERASQYYRLSDYDKAITDIKRAIANTPVKETVQLASEYGLAADIYTELKQYADALVAINKALEIEPMSYKWLYAKGNICMYIKDTASAKDTFQAMRRVNPRSVEALFGLAQVAVMEGRVSDAKEFMEQLEKLDSNGFLTFCRLGDLHRDMGEPQEAAADYLSAFALSDSSMRPMSSLMDLAVTDYEAVSQAVDYALGRTQNVVPLYFISGNAAIRAGKYGDAYAAYMQLLSLPQVEPEPLYTALGEICMMRGDIAEADNYLSKALQINNDVRNNVLKARVENTRGNWASALLYIERALKLSPHDLDALLEAARAELGLGRDTEALRYLTDAVMSDASDMRPLLVRGYMQSNGMAGMSTNVADFSRVAAMKADTDTDLAYKAIAQCLSGNALDAAASIKILEGKAAKSAEAAYLMALYSKNTGNIQQSDNWINKARQLGFENEYLLKYFNMPVISLFAVTR